MIDFKSLPFIVRLMTIANIFIAWLLFAELVIDRYGLDAYLPFYRFGAVCPYDVAAIAACVTTWWRLHR